MVRHPDAAYLWQQFPMTTIEDFIRAIGSLVSASFGIFIAIALLVFLFGLMKFIFNVGSHGKAEEGKAMMTWGLIALFVMVSVWGLVYFLQENLLEGRDLNL